MHTNRFLPPPVRLSQAIDEDFASLSGSACQITRRSFMKRTGGATVATLVAWNMASKEAEAKSNYFSTGSETPDWNKHILICIVEPTESAVRDATMNREPPVYAEGDQAWRNLPHINISDSVREVNVGDEPDKWTFGSLSDARGNGYSFHLLHWLSGGDIVRKGDFVAACVPGGQLASSLFARAAIVMGRWSYRYQLFVTPTGGQTWVPMRYKYVYSTICTVPAQRIEAPVAAFGHCPEEKIRVMAREMKSPWMPVDVDGKRVGWLNLSQCVVGSPDGLIAGQRYVSVATFLPRAILEKVTYEYSSTVNVSATIQGKLTKEDKERSGGLAAGWETAENVSAALKINSPPSMIAHHLDWDYIIASTDRGIQCESTGNLYPPMPDSSWLP